MAKTNPTTDTITGVALERAGGNPAVDHNLLASLRRSDGLFNRDLVTNGIGLAATARCIIDESTGQITVPTAGKPIQANLNGMFISMDDDMEEDGTADAGGTTTTFIDAGLESASDNYWVGAWCVWLTGDNAGVARQISAFDSATSTLTWVSALGSVVAAGDTFTLTFYFIEDKTDSNTNYVFMTTATKTARRGIAGFYANTTGTRAAATDLLVSSMVLDGDGDVTSSDNAPTGADRNLAPILGNYQTVQSVSINSDVLASASVQITATHSKLAYVGGITVTLSNANFSYVIDEHYSDSQVVLTITNDSAYTASCTVTVDRTGALYTTLDD